MKLTQRDSQLRSIKAGRVEIGGHSSHLLISFLERRMRTHKKATVRTEITRVRKKLFT